ncbi:MAG: NAD(P)-dependent oxidoreductase [Candidatus Ventricola sp.]
MRLVAFGGDARMLGAIEAAKRAGWETEYMGREVDAPQETAWADAVLLPWPHSFQDGQLAGTQVPRGRALAMLPPCGAVLHGSGVTAQELPGARQTLDPSHDEEFLRVNARLTAEGAIARAMQRPGRALLGSTCVVTGFGRIGQALTVRLTALDAFVIVCARNEAQMRRAHELGAHPLPLERIAQACAQADVIFNTVPARILNEAALAHIGQETLLIELASPPYGADPEAAKRLNVCMVIERGLPGRYAPMDAGAAMFEALQRRLTGQNSEGGHEDG